MTIRIVGRSLFQRWLVLGLTVAIGAACQRPRELHVPLDYRPTDRLTLMGLHVPADLRLAVKVEDARGESAAIGRNVEDSPEVPIYADGRTPDAFVREAAERELANSGIAVEGDRQKATKVLVLRLRRFWTDESSTYKTTVLAEAQLMDAAGRQLWSGQVSGANQRFGRSLKAENYQEGLSDASLNLVQNLLQSTAFVEALNAPAARAAEPRSRRR